MDSERYTDETKARLSVLLHGYYCGCKSADCALRRSGGAAFILDHLADDGLLLPPGGKVRKEWRVVYRRNGPDGKAWVWATDRDLPDVEHALTRCKEIYPIVWQEARTSSQTEWVAAADQTEWRVTYVNRNNERTIWEQCGNDEAVADRELAKAVAAGRDDRIRKESRPAGGVWPAWEEE